MHSLWPPEPKVVGSSPSWRTKLNAIFSMRRLPILEAFVVCVIGQMWTKRDKNRTQNRTQIFSGFCARLLQRALPKKGHTIEMAFHDEEIKAA